jgi:hypothetical protein
MIIYSPGQIYFEVNCILNVISVIALLDWVVEVKSESSRALSSTESSVVIVRVVAVSTSAIR